MLILMNLIVIMYIFTVIIHLHSLMDKNISKLIIGITEDQSCLSHIDNDK